MTSPISLDRRAFLGISVTPAAAAGLQPAWARTVSQGVATKALGTLSGEEIRLVVANTGFKVDGRQGHAVSINGTIPGPLLRLKGGQNVRLTVENRLSEDTSIHWHGIIVPFQMDGVPGISFPGIRAGQSFTYEFPIKQSGTYWYHSHTGLQEQLGHYGPIIIDPARPDPVAYEREHVVVLSDWTFMHPHKLFTRLKQEGGFFNRQKRTLSDKVSGKPDPLSPWFGLRQPDSGSCSGQCGGMTS